jgi:carboxymethylenebutenolidase
MERVEQRTRSGDAVFAALARPAAKQAPGLVMIHEWWGLNREMEVLAEAYAAQGYLALAIDMFHGKTTDHPDEAMKLMNAMSADHAHEVLALWIELLRQHESGNSQVGTLGYCLGGAWSLNASIAQPVDATVVYHGKVEKKASELAALKGPVLGHFALKETYVTPESARGFAEEMRVAGRALSIHFYDAGHAFARPNGPNYHKPSADLAWARTLEFLKKHLGGVA